MRRISRGLPVAIAILLFATSPSIPQTARVPLTDLGTWTYLGFQGGLYENGTNVIPADHATAGSAAARRIARLGVNGAPSPTGRIVFLSLGMSNTSQEFCSGTSAGQSYTSIYWGGLQPIVGPLRVCKSWTFAGQAWADSTVEKNAMHIIDGAQSGMTAAEWAGVGDPRRGDPWPEVTSRLSRVGLSEKQVQIVWLKLADTTPSVSLPAPAADAYVLLTRLGTIVRKAKTKFPNLQLVFLSSRIYGGYATTTVNPEPYAYESGFSMKWLVQAQITQMRGGPTDPLAASLDYNVGIAPWLAWGPYVWANGLIPKSDGLTWAPGDVESDGTHPAQSGEWKVGVLLLDFFKSDPRTRCWFVAGQTCP